jgi:hypothetical protein
MRALPGYLRVTHCRGDWAICVRPNLTSRVMVKAKSSLLNVDNSALGYTLSESRFVL